MRSGMATIQQTLTPEASSVLSHAISEAGRRNHNQVTPLHVAATLLASPSSFLRQACIRSHPNSSHPLQCRAIELCFSVALDRLPMTQSNSDAAEPPISNALMAALKRAQAQQRRGCPEQQQQPLLAVKVELEQLIVSILDDPSVSRVMREARFSSPAVKATIEKSTFAPSNSLCFRPNNSPYLNTRFHPGQPARNHMGQLDEVERIIETMSRNNKRNPVLVGDSELNSLSSQFFSKFERQEFAETVLRNAELVHVGKDLAWGISERPEKIMKLGDLIGHKYMSRTCNVILNFGDLKWLVEQPEAGRVAVEEVRRLLERFSGKLWLFATATCETYLRCQVYHSSMESDWDLQALPIAAKTPLHSAFSRTTGLISGHSFQLGAGTKSLTTASMNGLLRPLYDDNLGPASNIMCCSQCRESYEKEVASVMLRESDKPLLPIWLQTAKTTDQVVQGKELDQVKKRKIEELMKKWNEICSRLHGSFDHGFENYLKPSTPSMAGLLNPRLLKPKQLSAQQGFQPKMQAQRSFVETKLQLNPTLAHFQPHVSDENGGSPVRTELVLGRSASPEKSQIEFTKDFMSCISSDKENVSIEMQANKPLSSLLDADWQKKLMKTLMDKVWWQREAASAVASAIAQCKLGNGKQQGAGSKGNVWLLFSGPDRVGKKKMATALSELVCGLSPVVISLGARHGDEDKSVSFRGKTALDRIGEAIRRNPFSVVVLEDIDEADGLIRSGIKRAMESGRIADSHGRELSLGNVTFILTSNWLPQDFKISSKNHENDLIAVASNNLRLKLTVHERSGKRRATNTKQDRCTRPKKDMDSSATSFDLNEALDADDDDGANGSKNSSDLTSEEHEEEQKERLSFTSPAARELLPLVDSAIVFEPVDFSSIRQRVARSITTSFSSFFSDTSILVQDEALEKILGGIWLGRRTLEDWLEDVLVPSLQELKAQLLCRDTDRPTLVVLELDDDLSDPGLRNFQNRLPVPGSIRVAIDAQ